MAETEGFEPPCLRIENKKLFPPIKSYDHIYAHTSARCPAGRPISKQRARYHPCVKPLSLLRHSCSNEQLSSNSLRRKDMP